MHSGPVHLQELISASAWSTFNSKFVPIHTGEFEDILGAFGSGGSTNTILSVGVKQPLLNAPIAISV